MASAVTRVIGVDGTHPRGWLGVSLDAGRLAACTYRTSLRALLDVEPDATPIAIGLPLGHDDPDGAERSGVRSVDLAAQHLLGANRDFVVPCPPPQLLRLDDRADAARSAHANGWPVPSETHWLHRDRILDLMVRAREDDRLIEVVPEASFALLADALDMARPETRPGSKAAAHERLVLLHAAGLRPSRIFGGIGAAPGPYVLLDATVAAWTAERVRLGKAVRLGSKPAAYA